MSDKGYIRVSKGVRGVLRVYLVYYLFLTRHPWGIWECVHQLIGSCWVSNSRYMRVLKSVKGALSVYYFIKGEICGIFYFILFLGKLYNFFSILT